MIQCPHCGAHINKAYKNSHCPECKNKIKVIPLFNKETNSHTTKRQQPSQLKPQGALL